MFGFKFNQAKCETNSRLCVGRIKLIRNKKTVQLKQSEKDIAELLRNGKQEYARIRVEGVIREKLLMQAYEILELYLELLTVRTQLIAKTKELPRDMMEAVSSIIYAAQRINDLPELATLRALFAVKYGKEYAAEAAADATASRWQVNPNLIRCLLVEAPQPEEKLEMLSEIAQEYEVEWDLAAAARDMGVGAAGPCGQLPHGGVNGGQAAVFAEAAGPYPAICTSPAAGAAPALAGTGHLQYNSAQQAAVAAAQAAAQANAAAQYAAQVAALAPQGVHPAVVGNGAGSIPQVWQPHQAAVPGRPPSAGGGQFGTSQPRPPPAAAAVSRSTPSQPPFPDADAPPPPQPPPPGSSGSGASSLATVGLYVERSDSDIQRAYDAAQGPPTKGAVEAPLLPPAPAPPNGDALPSLPSLPSPPSEKHQASAPPPPPQVEDEYEELTRRLEALKKS